MAPQKVRDAGHAHEDLTAFGEGGSTGSDPSDLCEAGRAQDVTSGREQLAPIGTHDERAHGSRGKRGPTHDRSALDTQIELVEHSIVGDIQEVVVRAHGEDRLTGEDLASGDWRQCVPLVALDLHEPRRAAGARVGGHEQPVRPGFHDVEGMSIAERLRDLYARRREGIEVQASDASGSTQCDEQLVTVLTEIDSEGPGTEWDPADE